MEVSGQDKFLGTGWSFPPQFREGSCRVTLVNHEQDIKQSLHILLSTSPGERLMQPSFGCSLKNKVFEKVNEGVVTKIKDAVTKAVLFYEPRISLEAVNIDVNDDPSSPNSIYGGVMQIELVYTIRQTNTRSNLVYPFYFAEANGV